MDASGALEFCATPGKRSGYLLSVLVSTILMDFTQFDLPAQARNSGLNLLLNIFPIARVREQHGTLGIKLFKSFHWRGICLMRTTGGMRAMVLRVGYCCELESSSKSCAAQASQRIIYHPKGNCPAYMARHHTSECEICCSELIVI